MARRFGSAFQQNVTSTTFGQSPWALSRQRFSTAAGSVLILEADGRLYLAPSCYSEVRRVVFWACIRHEHTGAHTAIPVRLRVFPSSLSSTEINVESAVIAEGTISPTVQGGGLWSVANPSAEGALYGAQASDQNAIETIQFTAAQTEGSQLIFQQFDRFEAGSADFFNDWDEIAADHDNDRHVSYGVAIERIDGGSWGTTTSNTNMSPVIVSVGFAIMQAPSTNNRTRIYLPASTAYSPSGAISTTLGGERAAFLQYRADEWSGSMEIRTNWRQTASLSAAGYFDVDVGNANDGNPQTTTSIVLETFGVGGSTGSTWFARGTDVFPSITDGNDLVCRFRSRTGATQTVPYGAWEITVEGFNVCTFPFSCGHAPSTRSLFPGTPPVYAQGASLFDPGWFEDMEEERFLQYRIQGGILHLGGTNTNAKQEIEYNANLDADVSVSAFNTRMAPPVETGTDVTSRWIKGDYDITTANLVNLAGFRKLTEKFSNVWSGGTEDYPGTMIVKLVVNVPNSDVVELGPLFDVDAFDPEGCASTSAGLGDPGVLIITNGSTLPQKFNPNADSTRQIEDAGMPYPFEGEIPVTGSEDTAVSPEGGLQPGVYTYRYTFRNCCTGKESNPNPDDIVVDCSANTPAAKVTLSFVGVRIPGDPQICEICVYRTLEGGDYPIMAKIGCFNVDETTVITDELADSELDFTNDGLSIINSPMPCVPVVIDYRNRLFGMGDIPNLVPAGTVSVVTGSDIVQGDADVEWTRCLEGRYIKIGSDCRLYEILRVLPPDEGTSPAIARLKLTEEYEGTTDTGLSYVLCGRPNRLYFSEPLEPEYWPEANFLDVEPGDGDRLMGGASNYDSLVICKRRKSYVLRFTENPGLEVIVPQRVSSDIGCIGPRTFAQVEVGTVWLADRGLALFDGRSVQHVPESEGMNDLLIDPDNPNYVRRDRNGRVIDAVGVFYPKREQYLLLLPTVKTSRGCSLMLVWDVKLKNITLLQFCQEFQSMVVGKDASGNERVYLGDTNGFVWIYDVGDTDGVGFPNATGTLTGDVSFAGVDDATGASVLDSDGASFVTGGVPGIADLSGVAGLSGSFDGSDVGMAGACVFFRRKGADYDEPWGSRVVYAATTDRLYVTPQWGPDTPFDPTGEVEYEFMIGAIELDLLFKPQNYGIDDTQKRDWRQIVVHEIEDFASQLRIDLLRDFQSTDDDADTVVDPVTQETGEGRVFRMDYEKGRQIKPVGRRIYNHMALRMRNFAPEAPVRLINHLLCTEPRSSK